MTALHGRFGEMPYQYVLHAPLNDYQVTIEGPAGRAIITEVDGGEDYVIETMFYGQATLRYSVREWYGDASPRLAVERLVLKTDVYLANRGVEIPPLSDPRHKYAAVAIAVVAAVLVTVALMFVFTGSDSGDGRRPTAPITYTPAQAVEGPR